METLIVCLGIEHISDDGIGAVVGKVLQSVALPSNVAVCLAPQITFELLDKIASAKQLVLVEALACSVEPGTCTVVDVTDLPPLLASSECTHRAEVSQILDFVRYVECDGGPSLVAIAGIEARQSACYGGLFSEAVWTAVPRLVDLVLLYIGARLEARTAVKEAFGKLTLHEDTQTEDWRSGADFHGLLAV